MRYNLNRKDLESIGINTLLAIGGVYLPFLTMAIDNPEKIDVILTNWKFALIVVVFALLKTIQRFFSETK